MKTPNPTDRVGAGLVREFRLSKLGAWGKKHLGLFDGLHRVHLAIVLGSDLEDLPKLASAHAAQDLKILRGGEGPQGLGLGRSLGSGNEGRF